MRPLCWLDGRIQDLARARIDPLDRGFIFGDALYEWVKVLRGVPLRLDRHLERLRSGLESIDVAPPEGLEPACRELLEAAGLGTGHLYLQVSRGAMPRVYLPPRGTAPTVFIYPEEHPFFPPAGRPHRAVSAADWRWGRCDLKTTSLLGTVLGKIEARHAGVDEVVWRGPEGELREGGSTSLFVRRGDQLETHPLGGHILPGLTRAELLELAKGEGWSVAQRAPRLTERASWTEAFLCGTRTGVQPLVELDGESIAGGRTGEWTQRLAELLDDQQEAEARSAG